MRFSKLLRNNRSGRSSLKTLKYKNRHAVLQYLRCHEHASVAQLAKETNLSKMTVHNIMEHFLATGLVREAGKGDSTDEGGKKPKLFAFNPDFKYIFSVRIVEQAISSALTNLNGDISASHTAVHGSNTLLDDILRIVGESFTTLSKRRKVAPAECLGAVVGCHGIIGADKGLCVMSSHFNSWGTNVALRDLLEQQLPPGVPVFIDNWMRYHAYGEMKTRQNGGSRFYLIGTGYDSMAGGLVLDGKLQHGEHCLAGEIGHMIVEPRGGEACACGGTGCFEATVSPKRLLQVTLENREHHPDSAVFKGVPEQNATFKDLSFAALLEASNQGDELACKMMDEAVFYFAIVINNLVCACAPNVFVIQGEYANAGDYFLMRLRDRVNSLTLLPMKKNIQVEYSNLEDEYSLTGGACYISDMYFDSYSVFELPPQK